MRFPSVVPSARRGITILDCRFFASPAADVSARMSFGQEQDGQTAKGNQGAILDAVAKEASRDARPLLLREATAAT
jgi:hypothetical protein